MPYSGERTQTEHGAMVPVIWYLLNLLLIPVLGFAVLLWMFAGSAGCNRLRRAHIRAATFMSVIGAVLITSGVILAWFLFGSTGYFWSFALVWVIVLHTGFVLWGILALARAMADKPPFFPSRFL